MMGQIKLLQTELVKVTQEKANTQAAMAAQTAQFMHSGTASLPPVPDIFLAKTDAEAVQN